MSPQDFLLLHSALERTVALTMNITLASIVIKSFVFTSDVIVEAEYYVTVGNGNVSSLVSSLLKSVTTGLFTTYFVGFSGIKSADCSIIPITRVIDASPTSVPTMTPALIPSAMPTSIVTIKSRSSAPSSRPFDQPSTSTLSPITESVSPTSSLSYELVTPSIVPSSQVTKSSSTPVNTGPSASPTSVLPQLSSYQMISFTAVTTLYGLNSSIHNSKTAEPGFISSTAKSMNGVRYRDVKVIGFNYVALGSVATKRSLNAIVESEEHVTDVATSTRHDDDKARRLIDSGVGTVIWNVSVAVDRVGASNSSTAFTSLSNQLYTAMSSGSFTILMQASSTALVSMTYATVVIDGYVVSTFISPTASPTYAPTFSSTVPIISDYILTDITRVTVTVNVSLIKPKQIVGDLLGGSLYCICMLNGSVPSTIGGIKSSTGDSSLNKRTFVAIPSTSSYPITLPVKFSDLLSLQYYAIFCYAESSSGTGTSIEVVQRLSAKATTLCCKALDFSNTPVSVYGDLSKYTGSSTSLYVFKYDLSSAPSSSIMVVPVLYLDGIRSTAVTASPSSSTFLSTSSLSGQFILSASPFISGVYTIGFTFNGLSRSQYSNRNITVQILSSFSPLPAPVMISSQFSDSGQLVLITFGSPTDSANILSTSWKCSDLFVFTSASLTSCTWTSATTVKVSFVVMTSAKSTIASLVTGSTVTLLGGLLRSFCQGSVSSCALNPTATSATVQTLGPANPIVPTVVISASAYLGSCENLVLDATGSYGNGGRMYTSVLWTVSAVKQDATGAALDTSAIQTYLNAASLSNQVYQPITILSSSLTAASYTITLRLINFLGLSSSSTRIVLVSADSSIPSLTIIGPSYLSLRASSPLTILSVATQSSCLSKTTDVTYLWTVQTGYPLTPVGKISVSRDPSRFSLPAYNLTVDATYIVTITASVGKSSTSASVTVYVGRGIVTAAVLGGYIRSVPVDQILILDASISTDDDTQPTATSTLTYKVRHLSI